LKVPVRKPQQQIARLEGPGSIDQVLISSKDQSPLENPASISMKQDACQKISGGVPSETGEFLGLV
jgi:hypothetical protein